MKRFRPRMLWQSLAAGLVVLAGAACSSDDKVEDPGAQGRILTFAADPQTIQEGETTNLSWTTNHARLVRIDAGGVVVHRENLPKDGSLEVTPKASTTYRLEVVGKNGKPAVSTVAVEVQPLGAPTIERFEASASVVGRGTPTTLSWSVLHAGSVQVRESSGRIVVGSAAAEGSVEVTPNRATTYVLAATNGRGVSSQELTVAIGTPPTITLQADAEALDHGADAVLSWTVADADTVVVRDPSGGILHEGSGDAGSVSFSAVLPGTYTASAVGAGAATATASVTLNVRPVIERFTAVAQGAVRPGAQALVEWSVRGADAVEIENASGEKQKITSPSGSVSFPVGVGGGFLLRAAHGPIVAEAAASVQVVETPLIRSLTTRGLVTAGQGHSGTATVLWEIDGAATIRMEVDPGGMIDLTDKSPRADEVDVVFLGAGTITVTASNAAGQTVQVIDSPVDPVPTIRSFFAAPSRVGSGEATEIHWETLHAATVVLEMDGQEVAAVPPSDVNGFFLTQNLASTSSYVLRAYNTLGFEVVSAPLEVEIGAPAITSFRTTDGRSLYPAGTPVEFLWESDGGSSLTLTDEDGTVVCSPSEWTAIRQGGCSVMLPPGQAYKTFTLQVTNSSGTDSQSLEIGAVTGPIIVSFTTDRPEMTEGETINFSWIAEADVDGNIPTLTLVDQNGTAYPVDDADPLFGSKRFQIPTWGDYTFTLTARTEIDPPFPVNLPLTVYGVPVIGNLAANPPFAENEGDAVTFSWTSTHGASMQILSLDRAGDPGATLFSSNVQAEVDAGSTSLQPTIAEPHVRVVVRNPLGAPSHKDFRIGVDPATLVSFTANGIQAPAELDVLFGEEVHIEWETARADAAHYQEAFVDLSQRPNAVHLPFSGTLTTTAIETLQFPAGFVFPYDGEEFTAARIGRSGLLSFDLAATGTGRNATLPSTTTNTRRFDLLPFWDALTNGSIWWEFVEGDLDQLIIQWTKMNFSTSAQNPASLTFQVVLVEDGTFEFRYGPMSGAGNHAKGESATIAVQNRLGTQATVLSHNTIQQTGLSGRVYRFRAWDQLQTQASTPVPTPLSGSVTFRPTLDRTYHLEAWNGHSEHAEAFEIRVHPKAQLEVWANPAEPRPGDSTRLHWQGRNLTSLTIEDGSGTVVHTATSTELAVGSLNLGVLPQGVYTFQFHADGRLPWDQISQEFVLSVNPPFFLDSYTATDTFIKVTDPPVTLSWQSTGAVSGTITELPSGVVHNIAPGDLASGSLQVTPQFTTTYVLDLESHQRYRRAEILVEVRTVWIEDFTASSNLINTSQTVTLSWDTTANGRVSVFPREVPNPQLVETNSTFEDISGLGQSPIIGTEQTSAVTRVNFPAGFRFPFFDKVWDAFVVSADGWVSFDLANTSAWAVNQSIPTTNSSYKRISLPVFWDDLHTGPNGRVDGVLLSNPTRYVVQWTNLQRSAPSGNRTWDLNFQVVLYPNGSFEYRYGTMAAPPGGATSTSDCNPTHCQNEAMGSSATVGLQDLTGTKGFQLHHGAGGSSAPVFAGGFEGRSFIFDTSLPGGTGSVVASPKESTTFTLCIEDEFWQECQDVFVKVLLDTTHYLVDWHSSKPFIDIQGTGTSVPALIGDSGNAGIPTPVNMPFFDTTINMSTIWANANGWVSFAATQPSNSHFPPTATGLPRSSTATPAGPLIAVFWDDWGCTQSPLPAFFHHDQRTIDNQTVTILQWTNARRCSRVGGITFQLQLWSGGDIVIAVDEVWTDGSLESIEHYRGSVGWVGVEPADPTQHITYLIREPKLDPGQSIYYQRKLAPQP